MKFNIFMMLVIFCLCDLSLGTLYIRPIPGKQDAYYHHDLKKCFSKKETFRKKTYDFYTNSLGFKDNSKREVSLKSNKYRILFIGDSFTEGVLVPYDKTFVGIIDAQLGRKDFEILNAAVVSYSPKLYYLKVKYLIEEKKLHFDELYVYIDISDIQDELQYESFISSKSWLKLWIIEIKTFLRQHSLIYNIIRDLNQEIAPPSLILKVLYKTSKQMYKEIGVWTNNPEVFKKYGQRGLDLAKKNMNLLYELCKKHGIKMTIAVYPWECQIRLRELSCMQVEIWKEFCDSRKISFINYFPDFITDEKPKEVINKYFIKNEFHWNEAGHALIAQKWTRVFKGPPK